MSAHKIAKSLLLTAAALLTIPGLVTGQQMESHMGKLTGHADSGKQLYFRFCWGCHGFRGDGSGENWLATGNYPTQPYLNIQPRDFTAAVFKCRSTPTGTLPTDEDLFHAITRGFVATNMPQWLPLTRKTRVDLVAYVKTFSPRWQTQGHGTPITI